VSNNGFVYPAVAELDPTSPGPEIVLTDTLASTVRVLAANGVQLAAAVLPNPVTNVNYPNRWGGAPMVGDADGVPGPEIGVAGTAAYTLFKYTVVNGVRTLAPLWSTDTYDPSGGTTSALVRTPTGARIYYADGYTLWVFDGATGTVLQSIPNTSGTAFEGPAIASFASGAPGRIVVAASDYMFNSLFQHGVRIFADPALGPLRMVWNQHTYHVSNVANAAGALPVPELASWLTPFQNSYRVQQ
jgi:hypothetical protein